MKDERKYGRKRRARGDLSFGLTAIIFSPGFSRPRLHALGKDGEVCDMCNLVSADSFPLL